MEFIASQNSQQISVFTLIFQQIADVTVPNQAENDSHSIYILAKLSSSTVTLCPSLYTLTCHGALYSASEHLNELLLMGENWV